MVRGGCLGSGFGSCVRGWEVRYTFVGCQTSVHLLLARVVALWMAALYSKSYILKMTNVT